jgi:L,D-transpeptidase catalytic domain
MKKMHYLIFFFWFSIFGCKNETTFKPMNYSKFHTEAKVYCETNNFNTDYYILIDLSIHSGRNRFFVYNFKTQKNDFEKLTTHGSCDVFEENPTLWEKAKFGTKVDSHCSMKGKYSTGKRDYSKWGIHVKYWLNGLEKSNANSVERVTVLHSWEAISDQEVFPDFAPLSWGCPAVSNEFMTILDSKLQTSTKPVLLWIVD